MSVFISKNEKRGSVVVRHSWRIEVFSEFGDDPLIKAHRELVEYDADTGEVLSVKKDRVVTRSLAELNDGPRQTILKFAGLMDDWETEDIESERLAELAQGKIEVDV